MRPWESVSVAIVLAGMLTLLVGMCWGESPEDTPASEPEPAAAGRQIRYRATIETFACSDREFMRDVYEALRDSDFDTAEDVLSLGLQAGDCVNVPKWQVPTVTDVGFIDPL